MDRHLSKSRPGYAHERRVSLQVFLSNPEVPIDTNHLERALRPIPMGRRNWLFCWTELGAKQVGIIQSLIAPCKLHGADVYAYLDDVLQRVSQHPAKDVIDLTPRIWNRPGLKAIAGEIAVLRIPRKSFLPVELSADAQGAGLGQPREFGARWRPARPRRKRRTQGRGRRRQYGEGLWWFFKGQFNRQGGSKSESPKKKSSTSD